MSAAAAERSVGAVFVMQCIAERFAVFFAQEFVEDDRLEGVLDAYYLLIIVPAGCNDQWLAETNNSIATILVFPESWLHNLRSCHEPFHVLRRTGTRKLIIQAGT